MQNTNEASSQANLFHVVGVSTSSRETLGPWVGGELGTTGGSSPRAVRKSRAFSAAACSAAFLARATAVKEVCSYPPWGVSRAGMVRWHVNFGLAGGGGPSSITNIGVPPFTCAWVLQLSGHCAV